jgi:hypothetical protein
MFCPDRGLTSESNPMPKAGVIHGTNNRPHFPIREVNGGKRPSVREGGSAGNGRSTALYPVYAHVWPIDVWLLSRLCLMGLYPVLTRFPWLLKGAGRLDRPRLGRATTLHFVRASK